VALNEVRGQGSLISKAKFLTRSKEVEMFSERLYRQAQESSCDDMIWYVIKLHALAALSSGKDVPVPILYEEGRVPTACENEVE
jgi:hypothetical protein